jgi:hypothetical protein
MLARAHYQSFDILDRARATFYSIPTIRDSASYIYSAFRLISNLIDSNRYRGDKKDKRY